MIHFEKIPRDYGIGEEEKYGTDVLAYCHGDTACH